MKFENLPNLIVTEIVSAYVSHNVKSSQLREPVKNDCWLLCLKFEGKTFYRMGEQVHLSDINSAILIPPNTPYKFYCAEEGRIVSIYFKTTEKWDEKEIYVMKVPDTEKYSGRFLMLQKADEKINPGLRLCIVFTAC